MHAIYILPQISVHRFPDDSTKAQCAPNPQNALGERFVEPSTFGGCPPAVHLCVYANALNRLRTNPARRSEYGTIKLQCRVPSDTMSLYIGVAIRGCQKKRCPSLLSGTASPPPFFQLIGNLIASFFRIGNCVTQTHVE